MLRKFRFHIFVTALAHSEKLINYILQSASNFWLKSTPEPLVAVFFR